MGTWAIGDVQGCQQTLSNLLVRLGFETSTDRAWFVGDLVNRGPASLGVLRCVMGLGERATTVLGNHDLHLLARVAGVPAKERDTLDEILEAPDRDTIVDWLRTRPLLHESGEHLLVHAGFHPRWALHDAVEAARAAEAALCGPEFLNAARRLRISEKGDPLAEGVGVLTRIRMVDESGRLASYSGPPETAPAGLTPWWESSALVASPWTVVVGHWAALGLQQRPGFLAVDTGCIWGRSLTAVRLEDGVVVSVPTAADDCPRTPRRDT